MTRLADRTIDWGRIETWCEMSSGKAICGPVLARVRETAEKIEVERDEWHNRFDLLADENRNLNADLDKALSALREIADPENDSSELRRIARRAITEIEGKV